MESNRFVNESARAPVLLMGQRRLVNFVILMSAELLAPHCQFIMRERFEARFLEGASPVLRVRHVQRFATIPSHRQPDGLVRKRPFTSQHLVHFVAQGSHIQHGWSGWIDELSRDL